MSLIFLGKFHQCPFIIQHDQLFDCALNNRLYDDNTPFISYIITFIEILNHYTP